MEAHQYKKQNDAREISVFSNTKENFQHGVEWLSWLLSNQRLQRDKYTSGFDWLIQKKKTSPGLKL